MKHQYSGFIPENTAPPGATGIAVYDSKGRKVHSMGLGFLTPSHGEPLYRFGLLSDTHICPEAANGAIVSARLDAALTWFEQQEAVFVAHCGDAVNVGFENPAGTYNPEQFIEYKRIRDLHPNLPVYASSGNHESYNAPISDYQDEYVQYMGHDIRFTVTHGNDVFIFLGMPRATTLYVDGSTTPVPELAWLESQLSQNADKRCFVFIHPGIVGDSGDTLDKNPNDLIPESGYVTNIIKNALVNHGRAVLFHGHSHFMPDMQELDRMTNYTDKNGFPSVHVSSLGWASYIGSDGEMVKDTSEGFAYLVDVYEDYIIINGRDFTRNQWSPLGTLKVNA